MKTRLVGLVLGAVALAWANTASAAIITYTDRTLWANDLTSVDFTVDFESFVADTSFAAAPLDVGPFTLSTIGTALPGRNFVDVAPFLFPGPPASFGNAQVEIFVQDPLAADIVFDTPVHGFFADFLYAGNTQQLTLSLTNGGITNIQVPGPGASWEPFGFISTDAITSIRMSNSANDGFSMDNISGGSVTAVPAPATLFLLGTGLVGLVGYARRRGR